VYWLGGGSGAGKSTVARLVARRFDLGIYDTDRAMEDHGTRADPSKSALLREFAAMGMDERWVNRLPQVMLESFHWFRGEAFDLIVQDLLALPDDRPVVAEGLRLLPSLVKPLLASNDRAAWLVPTPKFRRAAFDARRPDGAPWRFVDQTSNPERALANLLERDRMFSEQVKDECRRLGLQVIDIDVGLSAVDAAALVAASFGLSNES
jgi:2-phosphoglycerate kinase